MGNSGNNSTNVLVELSNLLGKRKSPCTITYLSSQNNSEEVVVLPSKSEDDPAQDTDDTVIVESNSRKSKSKARKKMKRKKSKRSLLELVGVISVCLTPHVERVMYSKYHFGLEQYILSTRVFIKLCNFRNPRVIEVFGFFNSLFLPLIFVYRKYGSSKEDAGDSAMGKGLCTTPTERPGSFKKANPVE
jgi:hypothetical protein